MRTTVHGDYLVQLTRLGAFNCFLVRDDDGKGCTLVDTGLGGSAAAIMQAAQKLGLTIRRIGLTHAHTDHVGSLDQLHAALPEVPVAIGARESRFLAGDMTLEAEEAALSNRLRGGYVTCTTVPQVLLHAGERFGPLEVVAAPGHTPGQIAFFDRRDGSLLAGDAFHTRAGLAVAGTFRLLFPFPSQATWHRPTALATARHLRALEPTRLAVGHGPVETSPLDAIDAAIEAEARKIGEQVTYGA
jgi:glyoxylase-like metal-dependent hydrolase (beta-lactamase superfamily II)